MAVLLVLSAGLLTGCPEDLDVVPATGDPCERDSDCTRDDTPCGEVLACLDGRCQVPSDSPAMIGVCEGDLPGGDGSMPLDANVEPLDSGGGDAEMDSGALDAGA